MFSTYVEMIRVQELLVFVTLGVLHVCGDDPKNKLATDVKNACSPRMWR